MIYEFDIRQFKGLGNLYDAVGVNALRAARHAVGHTGDVARTQVRRALVSQTGLKYAVLVRAVRGQMAGNSYVIATTGGNIRLKFFNPRETRAGVSAAPWGKRVTFRSTFMKGGRFPGRVEFKSTLKPGRVYTRKEGAGKWPVSQSRSGLFIPTELTQGRSLAVFNATMAKKLSDRMRHELLRVLPGK